MYIVSCTKRERGGREREGILSSKRKREGGVNKQRGEKAEERDKGEVWRRGSGRECKVEQEEGRKAKREVG